jgi:hypothetical protein
MLAQPAPAIKAMTVAAIIHRALAIKVLSVDAQPRVFFPDCFITRPRD